MTLSPYAVLLGLTEEPGDGAPVFVMPFRDEVVGRPGFLQGGAIAGLLEVAARAALDRAMADAGVAARATLATVTVDYRRGGRDKFTRARGTVERLGRRVASVDALAWQDEPDRPIAAARITFLLGQD